MGGVARRVAQTRSTAATKPRKKNPEREERMKFAAKREILGGRAVLQRGGLAKNENIHLCPTNGKMWKTEEIFKDAKQERKKIGGLVTPPQTPNLIGVWERRGWVCPPPPSSWEVRFFSFVPLSFFFFFPFFSSGCEGAQNQTHRQHFGRCAM